MTRSQKLMKLAEERVRDVAQEENMANIRQTYRQLCKDFPVMVRTCGLCQSFAFALDKATREPAWQRILDDLQYVLTDSGLIQATDTEGMVACIRSLPTAKYMLATRQVVSAWLFFKRFAVALIPEAQ